MVKVYSDAGRTSECPEHGDGGRLPADLRPQLHHTVSAEGYVTELGAFNVTPMAEPVSVTLLGKASVTFTVSPSGASFTVRDASGNAVAPESASGGRYIYSLYAGSVYRYDASAEGYNGTTREFTAQDGAYSDRSLTESSYNPDAGDEWTIYGSGNAGKKSTITGSGTYYIGEGATGVITISTSGSVTLVGTGVGVSDQYTNLRIDCTGQATDLTLQDVYISNSDEAGNMINFKAPGNSLTFSGVSILDQDGNASGYAMVHVPSGSNLYVSRQHRLLL